MSKRIIRDDRPKQQMEKGFGTCKVCGKKTVGKSNDLCSRCGGTSVEKLVGYEEKTFTKKLPGWAKERKGYPARHYGNGHCPKCGMEIIIIGSQSCPKCGRIS